MSEDQVLNLNYDPADFPAMDPTVFSFVYEVASRAATLQSPVKNPETMGIILEYPDGTEHKIRFTDRPISRAMLAARRRLRFAGSRSPILTSAAPSCKSSSQRSRASMVAWKSISSRARRKCPGAFSWASRDAARSPAFTQYATAFSGSPTAMLSEK